MARRMISLDTETTGTDLRHGAKPYLVTFCDEDGDVTYFEWDVDPLTRQPWVSTGDLVQIQRLIDSADSLVLQNPKFDVTALRTVFGSKLQWDWGKVYDTLLAGHLLGSNMRHDLTSMAMQYLWIDVTPLEDEIKQYTNEARRWARKERSDWRIAEPGLPDMPSAKGTVWKYDMWLPRVVAEEREYPADHPWRVACSQYANGDSGVTLPLFLKQRELLKERKLWEIYNERLRILPVVCRIEANGVTLSSQRLKELHDDYRAESSRAGRICVRVAAKFGAELSLPKSGNNQSLLDTVFNHLVLKSPKRSKKTGEPSLDKSVLEHFEATLSRRSQQLAFVRALKAKRSRDTAMAYMEGYRKFWLPLEAKDWYILHPSLNPTGTDTLRWSSSNPNEQNISKKEGFNLRYCFGPAPGREWWSLDAKNIELRIPAYEAGETEMIKLFENPDEPPYFGSNHLLCFSILHPEKWDRDDPEGLLKAKKKYASTWYQYTKNGNFAVQYGSVESSGTADRAYHVEGGFNKIKKRFKKIHGPGGLNEKMIKTADRLGYVETMPDKTVDPKRGYPLLCPRDDRGGVKPTIPLNYHVQGTACWWMTKAMVRCQEYLDTLDGYKMILQVHDELVFDFPKARTPRGNLPKIRRIKELMEQGGDDLGLPTPVSVECHADTWDKGVTV